MDARLSYVALNRTRKSTTGAYFIPYWDVSSRRDLHPFALLILFLTVDDVELKTHYTVSVSARCLGI